MMPDVLVSSVPTLVTNSCDYVRQRGDAAAGTDNLTALSAG
jgi:hypothetical protein